MEEVVGVLPGGVEADDEVGRAVPPRDVFEALAQEGIAGGGLGEGQGEQVMELVEQARALAAARASMGSDLLFPKRAAR